MRTTSQVFGWIIAAILFLAIAITFARNLEDGIRSGSTFELAFTIIYFSVRAAISWPLPLALIRWGKGKRVNAAL
jgi:lipopolysaccharide export LptBFGC system permease protein LptF